MSGTNQSSVGFLKEQNFIGYLIHAIQSNSNLQVRIIFPSSGFTNTAGEINVRYSDSCFFLC